MPYEPHVDLFKIENEIKHQFSNTFGSHEVLKIDAGEYPSMIGVLLYLKHPDAKGVEELKYEVEENFASKGLRVGISIYGESLMPKGYIF